MPLLQYGVFFRFALPYFQAYYIKAQFTFVSFSTPEYLFTPINVLVPCIRRNNSTS